MSAGAAPRGSLRRFVAAHLSSRQVSRVVYGSIIGLALVFDFVNGMHDAANSIATIVSTRVLKPQWAVLWAAFFNFVAFLFFGLHVASTIGKGVVDPSIVTVHVIAAGLVIALAMLAHVLSAALFGALVPIVVKRMRGDPAMISTPAVTAIADLSGATIYLVLIVLLVGGAG